MIQHPSISLIEKRLLRPAEDCETQVEELQELVVHLSKVSAVGTSAAIVVHEVAQPITAAANYLSAAERLLTSKNPISKKQGLEAVKLAQSCIARSGAVMGKVKNATARTRFDPAPFDLSIVLAEVLEVYGPKWNLAPRIEIDPAARLVMGDPVQIAQVLANLIRNAMEATEGQFVRSLRVSAALSGDDETEIRIEDNGAGIAPKLRDHLFSAFSSTKPGGGGIGLSICNTIVKRHGGRIWADPLPGGTAFCFTIPVCKAVPLGDAAAIPKARRKSAH
ncbi:MAG: GHKL domain-containing protein [Sphingosinicella sp.]|nr:GHKL domain-containing protein [Sphingosinicella sp.]